MWGINITDEFENWFSEEIDNATRIDIRAIIKLLAEIGPTLGRPHADTVKNSKFRNMKELRIQSKRQVIRVFFIFDPKRNAVLLIGGNIKEEKKDSTKNI